jgi:hypothetical protein
LASAYIKGSSMVCASAGRSFCISCSCSATVAVERMHPRLARQGQRDRRAGVGGRLAHAGAGLHHRNRLRRVVARTQIDAGQACRRSVAPWPAGPRAA